MKVAWGTYPNHIGHEGTPGCFRCHDGEHATEDGRVIEQDCSTCHAMLAVDEQNPEVLSQLQPDHVIRVAHRVEGQRPARRIG